MHAASVLRKLDESAISECIVHFSEIDMAKSDLEICINDIGAVVTFSHVTNNKCGATIYFGKQNVRALNITYFVENQIRRYDEEIMRLSNKHIYNPSQQKHDFSFTEQFS